MGLSVGIVVRNSPGVQNDHIFFPVISGPLLLRFYFYPQVFLKNCNFTIFQYMTSLNWIFLGWVLTTRKVIFSKTLKSGDYFKYLQRIHISYSYWNITCFCSKIPPVVCYISMHQLCQRFQRAFISVWTAGMSILISFSNGR